MGLSSRTDSNVIPIRRPPEKPMQAQTTANHNPWSDVLTKIGEDRDRQAFAALFKHYAPQIKSYGLSTNGVPGLQAFADELVQETMIKVWRNAARFDPGKANATTWVFSIARNARIDLLRRGARHKTDLDADDVWLEAEDGEPVASLQQKRTAELIRESIGQLPIEQSQVLAKVYLEGKSHSEVSAELDLPLGTVKSRVRLALAKMKLLITE